LGLALEARGEFSAAEASLLKAVELDRTFAPRAVLAEYYTRRRDAEQFWPVAKSALEMSYSDVSQLFQDCWALSTDGETILQNAIPDRPKILQEYLAFLTGEGKLDAAAPVAKRVMARADQESLASLLAYCDRLLESDRMDGARAVWTVLGERKLIPYHVLPMGADAITNGDFRLPSIGAGFDWRFAGPGGIYVDREGTPPTIFVNFTGKQAESTEILTQFVVLMPKMNYKLSVRYRTKEIGPESGLDCLVVPLKGTDLLGGKGLLPGGEGPELEQIFHFKSDETTRLARLMVAYRRMPGTMRIEGTLILRRFRLEPEGGETP
jgi:hypothetical protein